MKKPIHTLLIAGIATIFTACWTEDIPDAGAQRPQVEQLTATPGDEEVLLAWSIPEGWNPSDYMISYTDADQQTVTLRTNGTKEYTVCGLVNDNPYTFNVQAVYGKSISNAVAVKSRPATTRFPVESIDTDAGDGYVTLIWTRPSTTLLSYTLSYYNEDAPDDSVETILDKEATTCTLEGLTNDKNYYFSLVVNYEKGASEATVVRAMPTLAVPYFLDRTSAAMNQPITFTFNTTDYPEAEDITWTFPDGTVLQGTTVSSGISSSGTKTVTLSARIDSRIKTWRIEVEIREYVLYFNDWVLNGANYEGFRYSCPVFAPDGQTLYALTNYSNQILYAFDLRTGDLKWQYAPDGVASASNTVPTVNPVTGDIYYGTNASGLFYAVTAEGKLKWLFTEAGSMQSAPPAVNAAGTEVYICDNAGNTFAIDAASGSKKWHYAAGAKGSGLLVNGGELVVGTTADIHFLSTTDGSLITRLTPSAGLLNYTGFAVSNDRKTAFFSAGTGLSSVDLETRTMKVDRFEQDKGNFYEPVVAPNGTVFAGTKSGWVCNFNAELTAVNWDHRHGVTTNTYNFSRPCVDAQNRFYITTGGTGNTNYIFNANGTVAEQWSYGAPSGTSADNDKQTSMNGNNLLDGVFYTALQGSKNNNGILVGRYVGAERGAGWSTHGGDICGSCCIK